MKKLSFFFLVLLFSGILSQMINDGIALGESISGRVTRESDGAGIQSVFVDVWNSNWNHVTATFTDSSGNYTVGGLAAGNYYVSTSNYEDYIDEYYNNKTSQCAATAVSVIQGSNTSNVNISLALGGSISGRVTRDSDGAGIGSVLVYVWDLGWDQVDVDFTDSSGNYTVGGLASGNYYVGTSNYEGYIDEYYNNVTFKCAATLIGVTQGSNTPNVNFSLALGGSITGRVTRDADGVGFQNVWVHVWDLNGDQVDVDLTDSSGNYTVNGLAAGNYYVSTLFIQDYIDEYYNNVTNQSLATAVSVTLGSNTTNINFGLAFGGSISGRVTRDSDGTGLQSVTVNVWNSNLDSVNSAQTDSSGNFTVGDLPTGSYYVDTSNTLGYIDEYYGNVTSRDEATLVGVTLGSNTPNVNFSLALGGSISGRVTRDSDGTGIQGVWVHVHPLGSNWVKSTTTDSSGNYTVDGLTTGSYHVSTSTTLAYVNEYYDNVTSESLATAVSVTQGSNTPNINFGLALILTGTISGRVTRDSDGTGIQDVRVTVWNSSWGFVNSASIGSCGSYIAVRLATGSYYVGTSNTLGYVDEYYGNVTSRNGATLVGVTAGSNTTNIDIGLTQGAGSISGRVTKDPDGTEIQNVEVIVWNSSWDFVKSTSMDFEDSCYTVGGLAPGSYYVSTSNTLGYINEYYDNVTSKNTATAVSVTQGSNTPNVNFGLALGGVSISGTVTSQGNPLSGVAMIGLPGSPVTDSSGNYSGAVNHGWSGTVTPSKAGYNFSPSSTPYSNVTSNQTQNYTGTLQTFTISGIVTSGGTGLSGVTMNGLPGSPVTNASGVYSVMVDHGWSGTAAPQKTGYNFSPPSTTYNNITSNQTQNYTAASQTFTISGTVTSGGSPLPGVAMIGLPGSPVTDSSGNYSGAVNYGWSGTVTPSKAGYNFSPSSTPYSNVTSNQTQNYTTALQTHTISGTVTSGGSPLSGVTMSGLPGNPVTDASGNYIGTVTYGWSGTVTTQKTGYNFSPPSTTYNNVTSNQTQNYTAALQTFTISGTVTSGGNPLPGVTMGGLPGNPVTDGNGNYIGTVTYGWSGTVTPTIAGYNFNPASQTFNNLTSNQTQNYTGTIEVKAGDCNRDGHTAIDEVQKAINQFLGVSLVEPCCDWDGNGNVTIDEVQRIINAFLE